MANQIIINTPAGGPQGATGATGPQGPQGPAAALVRTPVTLTDAATVTSVASAGNIFRVTVAGNRTIAGPTSPTDGQQVIFEITQDATGGRLWTLATGAGGFSFGADIVGPLVPSTTAGKTDRVVAMYRTATARWEVIGFLRGF